MTADLQELRQFAAELAKTRGVDPSDDQRASARHASDLPIDVRPVRASGEGHEPTGPPFQAVMRDLSTSGMSIIHQQATDSKLLAVMMSPPDRAEISVIVEVVRCRALGPYFEIAGQFVTRCEAALIRGDEER